MNNSKESKEGRFERKISKEDLKGRVQRTKEIKGRFESKISKEGDVIKACSNV
jgi:hypothetical protein